MTALVQAGLEVLLLLSALPGKGCFRFPVNVGWWCIKIRDTDVLNAISLMSVDRHVLLLV